MAVMLFRCVALYHSPLSFLRHVAQQENASEVRRPPATVPLFRGMTYMDPAAPSLPHDADILTRQQGAPKANSRRDDGGTFMKSGGRIGGDSGGNWIHFLFLLSSASRNILHEEKMMKNTCPCGDRSVGNFFVIKRSIDVKLICGDHSVKKPPSQRTRKACSALQHMPRSVPSFNTMFLSYSGLLHEYETCDTGARPLPLT